MNLKPVSCSACGESWPRDPALGVPCPQCQAPVGKPCKRPSGHGCNLHHSRDQAALDAGVLKRCTAAPPISGAADVERETRLDAERCTLEYAQASTRRMDTGKRPMSESPLFGGTPQGGLFE
jgi:hypothetical protein